MLNAVSLKRFRAKAFFITELWYDIYTTSVLADFFLGEVDTVGCSADGIAWSTIDKWKIFNENKSQESQQTFIVMKSHESHVWQQAFKPHCHSFSSGHCSSELAAGWMIMAGIENSVMLWQIIKCDCCLSKENIISPEQDFGQRWMSGGCPRLQTWPGNSILIKSVILSTVFNAVTEKVLGKGFRSY